MINDQVRPRSVDLYKKESQLAYIISDTVGGMKLTAVQLPPGGPSILDHMSLPAFNMVGIDTVIIQNIKTMIFFIFPPYIII